MRLIFETTLWIAREGEGEKEKNNTDLLDYIFIPLPSLTPNARDIMIIECFSLRIRVSFFYLDETDAHQTYCLINRCQSTETKASHSSRLQIDFLPPWSIVCRGTAAMGVSVRRRSLLPRKNEPYRKDNSKFRTLWTIKVSLPLSWTQHSECSRAKNNNNNNLTLAFVCRRAKERVDPI